jgi:hypothetical protein
MGWIAKQRVMGVLILQSVQVSLHVQWVLVNVQLDDMMGLLLF